MTGTIAKYNDGRGFGFIQVPQDRDVFFHVSSVTKGRQFIAVDEVVEFDLEPGGEKGPRAVNVRVGTGKRGFEQAR